MFISVADTYTRRVGGPVSWLSAVPFGTQGASLPFRVGLKIKQTFTLISDYLSLIFIHMLRKNQNDELKGMVC